jgi:hypothetical protein
LGLVDSCPYAYALWERYTGGGSWDGKANALGQKHVCGPVRDF